MAYTKLFSEIIGSTIWDEDPYTKVVWVTMLALKDDRHEVRASIPGLAHLARVSLEQCEKAIHKFLNVDKHSRSKEFEGRRIEEIDGGWHILNGEKYRKRRNQDERNEYMRKYMQKKRAKENNSLQHMFGDVNSALANISNVSPTEQNRTDKNKEKKKNQTAATAPIFLSKEDWKYKNITPEHIAGWKEAYPGINIELCLKQSAQYIQANPTKWKSNWQRFIVSWLKREQDNPRKTSTNGSGSSIDAWEMEWVKMMAHLRTKGNSARMEGLSDKGRTALQAIGGMSVLAMANEYKMSELKKEFKINYLT